MRKLGYYIGHILFGLIIAQFLIFGYQSNYIIAAALLILIAQSFYIFYHLNDPFLFIIYIFSLCIIYTDDILCGIVLPPFLIFLNYSPVPGKFIVKDNLVKNCLFVLIVTNMLGYFIKNHAGIIMIIQSIVIFLGIIFTFTFIHNFKFKKSHVNLILKIFTILSSFLFFVALNQKLVLIDSSLPLLGAVKGYLSVSNLSIDLSGRMPSLFGQYELFSEFALLMFILSFCIMMDSNTMGYYKFGKTPFILAFISFLNMLITGTRSSLLLMVIFLIIFYLLRAELILSGKTFILLLLITVLIPIFLSFGELVGLDIITNRLKELNFESFDLNSIATGEKINRQYVFERGVDRLGEENWFLGYGYGTYQANSMAWYGTTGFNDILDFHNLYLSIPMIYGWFGGLAYLLLIFYTIYKSIRNYFLFKSHPSANISLGFAFMFIFFLINEIKTNSLRMYNYHLLIWILLGFAYSLANTVISEYEESPEDC